MTRYGFAARGLQTALQFIVHSAPVFVGGNMANSQLEILCGWKEIAHHLGKGVRIVQRYERELGLPIRRPTGKSSRPGKSSGSVIATAGELDAWVVASPIRAKFRLTDPVPNPEMLQQLKRNIAEMARLRKETQEVRLAVAEGLKLLSTNIRLVVPGVQQVYNASPRLQGEELSFDGKKRKAQ